MARQPVSFPPMADNKIQMPLNLAPEQWEVLENAIYTFATKKFDEYLEKMRKLGIEGYQDADRLSAADKYREEATHWLETAKSITEMLRGAS